jgi:hypothetical protein
VGAALYQFRNNTQSSLSVTFAYTLSRHGGSYKSGGLVRLKPGVTFTSGVSGKNRFATFSITKVEENQT